MKIKKILLSLLTILPISSIAFAAEFQLHNLGEKKCPEEIEEEFLQRLEEQNLPLKYYQFLKKHQIGSTVDLMSDEFASHKKRLIDEYTNDYVTPIAREGGTISVM